MEKSEILLLIALGVLVICIISSLYKKMENFVAIDEITNEMNKQFSIVSHLNSRTPSNQINQYLPHFDVINSYKNKSQQFLDSIKDEVHQHKKEKEDQLKKLDNTIFRLSKFKNDNLLKELKNTDFKTIKSHNNGLNLSVNRIGYDTYQILVNDGCLKVTPENDYMIVPSNIHDKGQHFKFEHIFNEVEYRNRLSKSFPQLNDLGNVYYPFTLVKSKITDNCLKNNHGNLSIEPCREYEGQRWASMKTENTCNKLF